MKLALQSQKLECCCNKFHQQQQQNNKILSQILTQIKDRSNTKVIILRNIIIILWKREIKMKQEELGFIESSPKVKSGNSEARMYTRVGLKVVKLV